MSWVWLGEATIDFGVTDGDELDGERTVWLHADPYRVLGTGPSASEPELRRAYRLLARAHHPDLNPGDEGALEAFRDARQALAVATGEAELAVEPVSGDWWRLTGFVTPGPSARRSLAVAGLTFALGDLHRVPLSGAEATLRVTYAGRSLPLVLAHSPSPSLRRARLAAVAEYAVLTLLCIAIVPLLALLLAVDVYVLSDRNELLSWAGIVLILGLGYGALAAVLAGAGREVPTPRRAVRRARAAVAERRVLTAGRTRLG